MSAAWANNGSVSKKTGITHARALEIQEDLHAWARSVKAWDLLKSEAIEDYQSQGMDPTSLRLNAEKLDDSTEMRQGLEVHYLEGWVPTFCTKEFGLLAVTMARSAPRDAMIKSDLPAIAGLFVFEDPITLEARPDEEVPHASNTGASFGHLGDRLVKSFAEHPSNDEIEHVRALSWYTWTDTRKDGPTTWLCARVWTEKRPSGLAGALPVEGRVKLYSGGRVSNPISDSRASHSDWAPIRLLRSVFALLASPMTGGSDEARNPKIHPRSRRSTSVDGIRRVYLRHPEHARYEAEEERAAREGRAPVRLHWVRGHWRHQWYAKERDHHWIWIDGFLKGHPERGITASRKIQIARG